MGIPRPPAIPASLGVLVTLLGLGIMYWSLTGLGLLRAASAPVTAGGATGGTTPTTTGGGSSASKVS